MVSFVSIFGAQKGANYFNSSFNSRIVYHVFHMWASTPPAGRCFPRLFANFIDIYQTWRPRPWYPNMPTFMPYLRCQYETDVPSVIGIVPHRTTSHSEKLGFKFNLVYNSSTKPSLKQVQVSR